MFLLLRESFTNCSALVIRGKRITRKTLEPKLATFSATYLLAPCTMETTMIKVETERITPRRVRKDRSLCERKVSSAISIGSLKDTPRRCVPPAPCSAVARGSNATLSNAGVGMFINRRTNLPRVYPLPYYKTKIQAVGSMYLKIFSEGSSLLDVPQHLWFDEYTPV